MKIKNFNLNFSEQNNRVHCANTPQIVHRSGRTSWGKTGWEYLLCGLLTIMVIGTVRCQVFAQAPGVEKLERFELQRIRMGVPWQITLYAKNGQQALDATEAAFKRVKQLDQIMSDFDPDSELNQLCKTSGPGHPVPVSQELYHVLQLSKGFSTSSGGKFDITVGELTDLWRRAWRKKKLPIREDIRAALQKVGSDKILLNEKDRTVELSVKKMQLDLGGIAKGYAADEALKVLKKLGLSRVLIDASGDIVAGDPPPGRKAWVVGIAPLKNPKAEPTEYLAIVNQAVATSGDANRFVEIEGVRYSHIVDPQTGIGLKTSSSVTVIAKDGATSDALASALSVVDKCWRNKILKKYQAEAYIVIGTEQGTNSWRSCGYNKFSTTLNKQDGKDAFAE